MSTESSSQVRGYGYGPSLGRGQPVLADRFVCPVEGDVTWYRPRVGVPIPLCGRHYQPLVRG